VITLSSDTRELCDSGVKTRHFKGAQAAVQVLQVLLGKRSSAETMRGEVLVVQLLKDLSASAETTSWVIIFLYSKPPRTPTGIITRLETL
jgi:hypothetical protein